jgi:hypothetical protein
MEMEFSKFGTGVLLHNGCNLSFMFFMLRSIQNYEPKYVATNFIPMEMYAIPSLNHCDLSTYLHG